MSNLRKYCGSLDSLVPMETINVTLINLFSKIWQKYGLLIRHYLQLLHVLSGTVLVLINVYLP